MGPSPLAARPCSPVSCPSSCSRNTPAPGSPRAFAQEASFPRVALQPANCCPPDCACVLASCSLPLPVLLLLQTLSHLLLLDVFVIWGLMSIRSLRIVPSARTAPPQSSGFPPGSLRMSFPIVSLTQGHSSDCPSVRPLPAPFCWSSVAGLAFSECSVTHSCPGAREAGRAQKRQQEPEVPLPRGRSRPRRGWVPDAQPAHRWVSKLSSCRCTVLLMLRR